MGYRSDVTIIFYARGNSNDAGENAVLKLWFDENYPHYVATSEWCATIRQKDNAIIVKYRETRRYNIAIPFMKGGYTSNVGGNFLANREQPKCSQSATAAIARPHSPLLQRPPDADGQFR